MTNRKTTTMWKAVAGGSVAAASMATLLTGCSDPPPPPPPPPQAEPAPPPPPPAKSVADLMNELDVDPRVVLLENRAPRTEGDRRAVLTFFDGFARGNDQRLREMLAEQDQFALEDLITTGRFERTLSGLEQINIQTGPSPEGRLAVLAMFTVAGEIQPTLWYLEPAADGATFEAAPTPPDILQRIYGDDLIVAWHNVILEEIERSSQPDYDIPMPQEILATEGQQTGEGQPTSPGGDPLAPPGPSPGGPSPGGPSPGGPPI